MCVGGWVLCNAYCLVYHVDVLHYVLLNVHFVFFVVVNVYVPKDRVTNLHQGYGFVEFRSEEDADYVWFVIYFCSIKHLLFLP